MKVPSLPGIRAILPVVVVFLMSAASATRYERDIDWYQTSPIPHALAKRETSSSGAASGAQIVSFLQVLQQANIK